MDKNINANDNTNKRENKDQIPTELNEAQTKKVILEQDRISGQAREKTINDFPYVATLGRVLKDLQFPTDKYRIIQYLQRIQSTIPESSEILSILQQIEERDYQNVSDIAKASGVSGRRLGPYIINYQLPAFRIAFLAAFSFLITC